MVKEFVEIGSGRSRTRQKLKRTIDYFGKNNLPLYAAHQSRIERNLGFVYDLIDSGLDFKSVDNPTAQISVQNCFKHLWMIWQGMTLAATQKTLWLSAAKKGIRLGGNSKKRIRTLKRKKRAYLKKVKSTIRREQKKYKTVRGLMGRLNRMRFRNSKRGGWSVSEVHGLLRDLSLLK